VLGDVADQRDDDDADEELAQAQGLGEGLDRADQKLAREGDNYPGEPGVLSRAA
jgi:hypothetical protein